MRLGNKKEIQFSQNDLPEFMSNGQITPNGKLLIILLGSFQNWTITTLAKTLNISRQGIYGLIKPLIKLSKIKWFLDEKTGKKSLILALHSKDQFTLSKKSVYNTITNVVSSSITKLINYKLKTNNKNKKKSNKEFIHYEVMKSDFEEFIKLIGMGIDYFNSISIPSPSDTSCPLGIGNKSISKTDMDFINSLNSFLGKLKNTTTNPKEINSAIPKVSKPLSQRIRERMKLRKTLKPDSTPNLFLEKIFSLSNIPRHRVGTKIYQSTVKMLSILKSGRLFPLAMLNEKWLKQFDIPKRLLSQVWPEPNVLAVFDSISKAYTLGYEPADKTTLPKSLVDVLYNPRSHKSLFLKIAAAGRVRQLSAAEEKRTEKKLLPQEQNVLNVLKEAVEGCFTPRKELNPEEHKNLVKTAKELIMTYDNQIRHLPGGWDTMRGFAQNYADWIQDEFSGRLEFIYFGLDSKAWRKYKRERGFDENQ